MIMLTMVQDQLGLRSASAAWARAAWSSTLSMTSFEVLRLLCRVTEETLSQLACRAHDHPGALCSNCGPTLRG